jgi:hypothetical protein
VHHSERGVSISRSVTPTAWPSWPLLSGSTGQPAPARTHRLRPTGGVRAAVGERSDGVGERVSDRRRATVFRRYREQGGLCNHFEGPDNDRSRKEDSKESSLHQTRGGSARSVTSQAAPASTPSRRRGLGGAGSGSSCLRPSPLRRQVEKRAFPPKASGPISATGAGANVHRVPVSARGRGQGRRQPSCRLAHAHRSRQSIELDVRTCVCVCRASRSTPR